MTTNLPPQGLPQLRFILDEAADEDYFGPHQRIADAIADVIRSDNRLNVIGLLGSWGSGKSTVVRLITKNLNQDREEDAKHLVFTYDAWLHQSDPPRRAFLETLIKFLCQKGLTTDKAWRVELDKLSGRIREKTTTDTPLLTRSGRLILLSLALVPYGSIFVSHDWYRDFHSAPWLSWTSALFIFGVLIFVAPLLIALYFAPLKLQNNEDDGEALSIFLSKQIKKNKNTTVTDPDPTAIEFQRIFRKIIELPTLNNRKRKIIFVIDNLDRLPASDSLTMWATIRSFFLGAVDSNMLSPSATPTIILPIGERKFLELSGLAESADKAVRHVVLPALGETNGITTLEKDADVFASWIANSETSTVDVLSMKIRDLAKVSGEIEAASILSLASKLGIHIEPEATLEEQPAQPNT